MIDADNSGKVAFISDIGNGAQRDIDTLVIEQAKLLKVTKCMFPVGIEFNVDLIGFTSLVNFIYFHTLVGGA